MFVVLVTQLYFQSFELLFELLIGILLAVLSYGIEISSRLNHPVQRLWQLLKSQQVAVCAIVLIPILEELVFRSCLYQVLHTMAYTDWQFGILSVLAFVIGHIFHQAKASLYKFFIAVMLTVLYLATKEIYLSILVHMCFNLLVYLGKVTQYQSYHQ